MADGLFLGELLHDILGDEFSDGLPTARGNPPADKFASFCFRPVCLVLAIT